MEKPYKCNKKSCRKNDVSQCSIPKQLSNLKIFGDEKHTLEAQKPELIDFASQNRKNKVS